jgi:hypothetical protein
MILDINFFLDPAREEVTRCEVKVAGREFFGGKMGTLQRREGLRIWSIK